MQLKHKKMGSGRLTRNKVLLPRIILLIILVAIIYLLYSIWTNPVVKVEFTSQNLPKRYIGTTFAHVTCIHNDASTQGKVVSGIKDSKPDFILVSGGFADAKGGTDKSVKYVNNLCKIAPVYYILQKNDLEYTDQIASTGATLLQDSCIVLNELSVKVDKDDYVYNVLNKSSNTSEEDKELYKEYVGSEFAADENKNIVIAGLGVYSTADESKYGLYDITDNLDESFRILMIPQEEYFDMLSYSDIDIMVAGGNHGNDLGNGKKGGVYANNGTSLFLTTGVGSDDKPVRATICRDSVQIITLGDGIYGEEGFFERLSRKLIPNTGTIFDNDGGLESYKVSYGDITDAIERG